jgi:hypothetical protein
MQNSEVCRQWRDARHAESLTCGSGDGQSLAVAGKSGSRGQKQKWLIQGELLFLFEFARKMAFHFLVTQRVSCSGQHHRIDNLVAFNLCSDKSAVFRQFLVNEFHFPAVFKPLDPLLVWHVHTPREEARDFRLTPTRLPAFLPETAEVFVDSEIRVVARFNSAILADMAMRGWAISFLMPARVVISSLVCFLLLNMRRL